MWRWARVDIEAVSDSQGLTYRAQEVINSCLRWSDSTSPDTLSGFDAPITTPIRAV